MNQIVPIVNERKVKAGESTELVTLESLIKGHYESMERLKHELRASREMYKDGFDNDPGYREKQEAVKAANKERLKVREAIASNPNNVALKQKIVNLREDFKDQQETLSELLLDFNSKTAATQLEIFTGQIFEIVRKAKVVRKRS